MMPGVRLDNAVPFAIPARFLITGAAALSLALTALALRPSLLLGATAAPGLLAVVHTLTLGFAAMILLGAMHQLMPVMLVTSLHAPKLGVWTYVLYVLGSAGVIGGFALGFVVPLLAAGGTLIVVALWVFLYNLIRTAMKATVHSPVGHALVAAGVYLTLTATFGVLLGLERDVPALARVLGYATPLHLGLGLFGAFLLAIAGAGHKLLGMFTLSHGAVAWRLRVLTYLVHLALLLIAAGVLLRLPTALPAVLALGIAAALYALDVWAILQKRMRKALELPMRHYVLGGGFLLLAIPLALVRHYSAALYSVLGGFIVLAVAGMLVKIASFLTWQHRYAKQAGKTPVPLLKDMTQVGLEHASFWALGLGALLNVAALFWQVQLLAIPGTVLSAIGAWSLLSHVLWIIFGIHRPRPREAPAAVRRPA